MYLHAAMLGTNRSLDLARERSAFAVLAPLRVLGLAFVALALVIGGWYAAQVFVLDHSASAAVSTSVANPSSALRPGATISVSARGAGVDLESAQLYRADVSPDGSRSAERPVATRLDPTD